MKKVILSAAFVAIAGFTAVSAKSIENTTNSIYAVVQDSTQSKEVKLEELPAPVKATLGAEAYKDWTPASATWVKAKEGEHFAITLTKGQEKAVLKIDPTGKVIQ